MAPVKRYTIVNHTNKALLLDDGRADGPYRQSLSSHLDGDGASEYLGKDGAEAEDLKTKMSYIDLTNIDSGPAYPTAATRTAIVNPMRIFGEGSNGARKSSESQDIWAISDILRDHRIILRKRSVIRSSNVLTRIFTSLWKSLTAKGNGIMDRSGYFIMYEKLLRELTNGSEWNSSLAETILSESWEKDRNSFDFLNCERFSCSIFAFTEQWVKEVTVTAYESFLRYCTCIIFDRRPSERISQDEDSSKYRRDKPATLREYHKNVKLHEMQVRMGLDIGKSVNFDPEKYAEYQRVLNRDKNSDLSAIYFPEDPNQLSSDLIAIRSVPSKLLQQGPNSKGYIRRGLFSSTLQTEQDNSLCNTPKTMIQPLTRTPSQTEPSSDLPLSDLLVEGEMKPYINWSNQSVVRRPSSSKAKLLPSLLNANVESASSSQLERNENPSQRMSSGAHLTNTNKRCLLPRNGNPIVSQNRARDSSASERLLSGLQQKKRQELKLLLEQSKNIVKRSGPYKDILTTLGSKNKSNNKSNKYAVRDESKVQVASPNPAPGTNVVLSKSNLNQKLDHLHWGYYHHRSTAGFRK